MKTFGRVALVGFTGLVVLKTLGLFVLPIVGLALKFAVIMAVGYAVLTLFKRYRTNGADSD